MMLMHDEIRDLRAPPEQLSRWAMQTPFPAQEATYFAIAFLARVEHASATLLPAPDLVLGEKAVLDQDGYLRQPRGALEHFRLRSTRALAWLDQLAFFRERFSSAAERAPAPALLQLGQTFAQHDSALEAAVDVLVRECVMPELEEVLLRALTYPPLQLLLGRLRESDPQRTVDARRLAASVLGPLTGKRLWAVRKRLISSSTRAVLGALPLLAELERAGLPVERKRAAGGFARRMEEAVGELAGERVLPAALLARLLGSAAWSGEAATDDDAEAPRKTLGRGKRKGQARAE